MSLLLTILEMTNLQSLSGQTLGMHRIVSEPFTPGENQSYMITSALSIRDPASDFEKALAALSAAAAPPSPNSNQTHLTNTSMVDWLSRHHNLQEWLTGREAAILRIRAQSPTELSDAMKCLSPLLEKQHSSDRILKFEFDSRDDRFNTLEAMFSTFLTQILSHLDVQFLSLDSIFKYHSKRQTACARDLYRMWSSLWSNVDLEDQLPSTYLIGRIDQCSRATDADLDWLLDRMSQLTYKSERTLKFIVTSVGRSNVSSLEDSGILSIDSKGEKTTIVSYPTVQNSLERDVTAANGTPQNPLLGFSVSNEEQSAVEQFLLWTGSTKESIQLVRDWIKCRDIVKPCPFILNKGSPRAKGEAEGSKSSFFEVVLVNILESLPIHLHSAGRLAVALLVGCLRPLFLKELNHLLFANIPGSAQLRDYRINPAAKGPMEQILYHLSPCLLDVDNTICLKYEQLRDIFSDTNTKRNSTEPKWYTFETENEVHGVITQALLTFLSTEFVLADMTSALHCCVQYEDYPVVAQNYDIMAYAVSHWPTHYRLANNGKLLSDAQRFFDSSKPTNWRQWARMHRLLANSVAIVDEPPTTPFTASCSLGLDDLALSYLQNYQDDIAVAVIEAARHGHSSLAKSLIANLKEELWPVYEILNAAMSSCSHDCMIDLVNAFLQRLKEDVSVCPPSFPQRCAALGYTGIVERLIEAGIPMQPNCPDTSVSMTLLQHAVAGGHFDTVTTLIEHGVALDDIVLGESEMIPLSLACTFGYTRMVTHLLHRGASPDGISEGRGIPPLIAASLSGRYELIVTLCNAGANPDISHTFVSDDDDELVLRPIDICAMRGFERSLKSMLGSKANVNLIRFGGKPLSKAIKRNHPAVIQLLLEAGATLDVEGVLDIASTLDNPAVIDLLMSHQAPTGDDGDTVAFKKKYKDQISEAFLVATQKRSLSMIRYLATLGADVEMRSSHDRIPLFLAARNGEAEIVKALLDLGASIDSLNDGWTPLQIAYDSAPVVRLLLANEIKPDVDQVGPEGSVLHLAAKWNYVDVVKVLLEYSPRPNLDTTRSDGEFPGISALSAAVLRGNTDVVRILLDAGADVNHVSENGNCPLHFALWSDVLEANDACLRLLLSFHPDLDIADAQGDIPLTCFRDKTPALSVELLLRAGANPELANQSGETPLLYAVSIGNIEVARCLLGHHHGSRQGVRPNVVNRNGKTPLHIACRKRDLDFVKLLVEHGANVNLVGSETVGTPLQVACERRSRHDATYEDEHDDEQQQQQCQRDIITYLICDADASVNKSSGVFGSALGSACVFATEEIVQLLYANGARLDGHDDLRR